MVILKPIGAKPRSFSQNGLSPMAASRMMITFTGTLTRNVTCSVASVLSSFSVSSDLALAASIAINSV